MKGVPQVKIVGLVSISTYKSIISLLLLYTYALSCSDSKLPVPLVTNIFLLFTLVLYSSVYSRMAILRRPGEFGG